MQTILIKLLAMLFPVVLGYGLKRVGFFGPTDYRVLAKIAINITLPCTVVASFASLELDKSLLGVTILAFVLNWLVLLYAWITSRGIRDPKERCRDMFCVVGFNMGNFLIPFAQQFMGSAGVAVTALFDAGNSPMCTGGHYIFTTSVVSVDGKKTTLRDVVRKLFSSPALIVYLVMIAMMLADIPIPGSIASICELTGNANAFVSMFMMGLMFEIRFDASYMKAAIFALSRKYLFSAVAALCFYTLLPFDLLVRQVLVLIAFAPIPSLAAIFTENIRGDVGLCSFITSCSFIISSVIITILIFVMHVA
ncbi:MAG: hypothetical protein LUF00_07490 [Lachnospiraceae bacterium]|nr:hypothetical protein [Lachnospiraceae bacterium]